MISILLGYITILLSLIILLYIKIFMQIEVKLNLDSKVLILQDNYKKMIKSKRIVVDLCDLNDKLGDIRSKIYSVGNNCEPWIARECIFILDHIIPYNTIALEWSAGSSTIWLGYRVKHLISIENNYKWASIVKRLINRLELDNKISLNFIGNDDLSYCKNESIYLSSNNLCYKTYVSNNIIGNRLYDYISIDGRARTGCIIRAMNLIKKENGIIVIDNSDRNNYQWAINRIPKQWSRFDYPYVNGIVSLWITHSK